MREMMNDRVDFINFTTDFDKQGLKLKVIIRVS